MTVTKPNPAGLAPTAIALIASRGDHVEREVIRYVTALPATAVLRVHAHDRLVRSIRAAVRRRKIPVSRHPTTYGTVMMANLCVIFGDCPFSPEDIDAYEQQGIPIEGARGRRGKGRG